MEKNNRKIVIFCTILCLVALSVASSAQEEVTAFELMNNSRLHDDTEIVYMGEVVGPVLDRGTHSWVNTYDGRYAIGVYTPKELVELIETSGDYGHQGDIIQVEGTFNRACVEHGGDIDIHAKYIRVLEKGHIIEHPVSMSKVFFALLLMVANIPMLMVLRRLRDEE